MYRVVKTHFFDCAHRIRGHQGRCQHIHGHTFCVEVCVRADELDELGMVIDFGKFKKLFSWIDEEFDHTLVLGEVDARLMRTAGVFSSLELAGVPIDRIREKPLTITSETLAKHFFLKARELLLPDSNSVASHVGDLHIEYVRVYEQLHPTISYAEYRPS